MLEIGVQIDRAYRIESEIRREYLDVTKNATMQEYPNWTPVLEHSIGLDRHKFGTTICHANGPIKIMAWIFEFNRYHYRTQAPEAEIGRISQ